MSALVEEIKKVDCGNYYLSIRELQEMVSEYGIGIVDTPIEIFKAGFIKGIRAERARQKKEKKQ